MEHSKVPSECHSVILGSLTLGAFKSGKGVSPTEPKAGDKLYCVSMLPYPSGNLHVGHLRNYIINDVVCRYYKLHGLNTLMPMGWDAFGIPAENAAVEHSIPPSVWVRDNIARMKELMKRTSLSIDWKRELTTSHPSYYAWGQWLLLKLFRKGLAYKELSLVNWDPVDGTVLSNEQVIDGRGWRSGSYVRKRFIDSLFLRIRKYSEDLLCNLAYLNWPSSVKVMQRNWIDRKTSIEILLLCSSQHQFRISLLTSDASVVVEPAVLVGNLQHWLFKKLSSMNINLYQFLQSQSSSTNCESSARKYRSFGVGMTFCFMPTNIKVTAFASNFNPENELSFLSLKNKEAVLFLRTNGLLKRMRASHAPTSSRKPKSVGFLQHFLNFILRKFHSGRVSCSYGVRDWNISRQRLWGTPIPIVNCKTCGGSPVNWSELPVILSENYKVIEKRKGGSIGACNCSVCGALASRESETLDTFFDSSWYFYRYTNWNNRSFFSDQRTLYWLPVDLYVGGIEHSVLHLLYLRFIALAMADIGLLNFIEPIEKLFVQGPVVGEAFYKRTKEGQVVWVEPGEAKKPDNINHNKILSAGKCKMSKSKKNGYNPDTLISQFGSDTVRLFILSLSPPDQTLQWSTESINGIEKFVNKLLLLNCAKSSSFFCHQTNEAMTLINEILEKIEIAYKSMNYNKIFSSLINITKVVKDALNTKTCNSIIMKAFKKMVSASFPVLPNISSFLWRKNNYHTQHGLVWNQKNSMVSTKIYSSETNEIVLQINGKAKQKNKGVRYDSLMSLEFSCLTDIIMLLKFRLNTRIEQIWNATNYKNRVLNVNATGF